jgi:hypothetical protein
VSKCDDMFHETFPNVVWQDDTAIRIWRECWKVCSERMIYQITHRNKLFTDGMRKEYEDNKQIQLTEDVSERPIEIEVYEGESRSVRNRTDLAASASAIAEETLGRIRRRRS